MNKKGWMIVLVLVLIAGLGYAGFTLWDGRTARAQESTGETVPVRRGTLVMTVEGTGSLAPRADVELAFLTGGPVAEVLVDEGQTVEAAQPLIRLETNDLESQVAQAKARLASAEAQLAQLLAGPRAEDIAELEANLQAAQSQLSAAAARRDRTLSGPSEAEIADAQAQVASAEADHRNALIAYDSTDKDDEDQKEQARYDLWAAEVALEAARTQLEEVQAGPDGADVRAAQADVAEAEKRCDAAQAQLDLLLAGPTEEQVDNAEAAVKQAQVALAQAELRLERATLTAPTPGTVVALEVGVGEIAGAGQTVAVLNDLSALEVEINVDETDVAQVSVGQEARITLDAFPEAYSKKEAAELSGEVTYVAPQADVQAGVVFFPVTVRLESTPLPVKAGMTADVELIAASQEDALIVPLRAVHSEGERTYVDRLVDGQVEQVDVTLGMMTNTEVEITDGLAEGDVVIVAPSAEPTDGPRMPGFFGGGGN
jgi:HlyD family secretion protein